MQDNMPVIIAHYFLGVGAFVAFLAALLSPKGRKFHRRLGLIATAIYGLMLITGLAAGLLYHFYNDNTIKLMLWMQTFFAFSLLVQGISTQRNKKNLEVVKSLNFPIAIIAFIIAVCTIVAGAWVNQSISCCFGIVAALLIAKNIAVLYYTNDTNYNWRYFHSSAMIMAGALLLLNGTGFFGVHNILDARGAVSWHRVLMSFMPFTVSLLGIDLWLYKYI